MDLVDGYERSGMAENTETIKQGFEAFNNGDSEGVMETWTDDIKWEGSNSDDLPGGGSHEGKEDVMKMLGEIGEHWESFEATPDEFFEDGDTVVVLGHSKGKPKEGGEEIEVPFVHIWRMEDGKGKRVQALTDTLVVARALGVA